MTQDHAGLFAQIAVYFGRCCRAFVNDKAWKNFISVALIVIIIGLVLSKDTFVTYMDTQNGAFALVCACIWIGIFNSIRSICRERDILKREYRTGLMPSAYIAAHWLYEAILCAAEALLVTILVSLICLGHLPEHGVLLPPVIELCITFFLIIFSSDALGLLISSIVKTENTAMTIMPFALIVQLVMSGLIFKLEGAADLISNLTISRWGLDAICATSHMNEMAEVGAGYFASLGEYAASTSNLLGLWSILLVFAVVYGVLAAIALHGIDK